MKGGSSVFKEKKVQDAIPSTSTKFPARDLLFNRSEFQVNERGDFVLPEYYIPPHHPCLGNPQ